MSAESQETSSGAELSPKCFEKEELSQIVKTAQDCRDRLVIQWREVSKPRRQGAICKKPAGAKLDFKHLFDEWLQARGLGDAVMETGRENGWRIFSYVRCPAVQPKPDWELAYHGTWWYSLWSVLHSGVMLESDDRDLGHDYWEPGVYCTPNMSTARWYARPQILFGDGVFHRVVFELRVDQSRRKKNRQRGGVQWVYPLDAVSLHGFRVQVNSPPVNGEERVREWDPQLEAIPQGCVQPMTVANSREGPWPDAEDSSAEEEEVPPHLMGSNWNLAWRDSSIKRSASKAEVAPSTTDGAKRRRVGDGTQSGAAENEEDDDSDNPGAEEDVANSEALSPDADTEEDEGDEDDDDKDWERPWESWWISPPSAAQLRAQRAPARKLSAVASKFWSPPTPRMSAGSSQNSRPQHTARPKPTSRPTPPSIPTPPSRPTPPSKATPPSKPTPTSRPTFASKPTPTSKPKPTPAMPTSSATSSVMSTDATGAEPCEQQSFSLSSWGKEIVWAEEPTLWAEEPTQDFDEDARSGEAGVLRTRRRSAYQTSVYETVTLIEVEDDLPDPGGSIAA